MRRWQRVLSWAMAASPALSAGACSNASPADSGRGESVLADTQSSTAFAKDFPDPAILPWNGTYYAYATGARIATMHSTDLKTWSAIKKGLRTTPAWADARNTWAPMVLPINDTFVMYYAISVAGAFNTNGAPVMCISRAVATDPAGPFDDTSRAPMICQTDRGGSIDPSAYYDEDMNPWLVWKSDGNCCDLPTHLSSARLAADGLSTVGAHHDLLVSGHDWERGVVEGPSFTRDGGQLYLFYSGNLWNTEFYSMGYALCDSPSGPCIDQSVDQAWAFSHAPTNAWGPGGGEWFREIDSGTLRLAYHAWSSEAADGARTLRTDTVTFPGGTPKIMWSKK